MFESFKNTLCVHGGWLYGEGDILSYNNYLGLRRRNKIKVLQRGGNGRKALVEYDSLPLKYQRLIVSRYGDPKKKVMKNSFEDLLIEDHKAEQFFKSYVMDNGKNLPEDTIIDYINQACIFNAVGEYVVKRMGRRAALGGKSNAWEEAMDAVAVLPKAIWPNSIKTKNVRRFREKYNTYKKTGYESLIHKGFCNVNSQKLTETAKHWLLARWSDRVRKCPSITRLWAEYNAKAEQEGWTKVKEEKTVRNFINDPEIVALWEGFRYGELKTKERRSYQHSTKLPSVRDALWYADGTKMNYYYMDEQGKTRTCMVYEVMDAYSEVLLGYHISKSEDYIAQFNAFKMASQVSGHRPYEVRADNQGGHKKLEAGEFMGKIARLSIRTAPYNGKSKTIESAFGRFQAQFLKQDWFFTGQNIDTKRDESKANHEFIQANRANLLSLEEVKKVYKQRREEWNNAPHPNTGIPRNQMYMSSKNEKAKPLNIWDQVDMFWILRDKPVTMRAYGLTFTDKTVDYTYVVFDEDGLPSQDFLDKHVGRKFFIKYDPDNREIIKLYTKGALGLTFVADAEYKPEIHRAIQEQEDGEMQFYQDMKAKIELSRIAKRDTMLSIQAEHGMSAEDYGMNEPRILGVESSKAKQKKKKKASASSMGEVTKAQSNMTVLEDEEQSLFDMLN